MAFSAGVYTLPGPALVTGEIVSATENNQFRNDVATAFNLTFLRNGTSTATANLPMGGYKLTGLAAGSANGDSARYEQVTSAVAITGGTINGAVIGGSTAAAGTFTDLTTSGTVTVSGGTANGVAYLNGSKVLTTGSALTFDGTNFGGGVNVLVSDNKAIGFGSNAYWLGNSAGGYMAGYINGSEGMRLTSTGLGIGTSSPTKKLDVNGGVRSGTGEYYFSTAFTGGSAGCAVSEGTANTMLFWTTGSERMRIDSSGNLLVGTTSTPSSSVKGIRIGGDPSATSTIFSCGTKTTENGFMSFINGNGTVGSIISNGSSTSFNTSSDYRLKENIQPMQNALEVVQQLNPVTYTWKADGSDGQGFIAHELQAVVPDCVTGEKDATRIEKVEIEPAKQAVLDEEGNEIEPAVEAVYEEREVPVYQGIDTSFLVATLCKAIQELKAEVDALKQAAA